MSENRKFVLIAGAFIVFFFSVVGWAIYDDNHTSHRRESVCDRMGGVDGWKYDRHLCLDRRTGAVLSTWEELDHR